MESLPEVIQDKINLNIHELKFVDTLNLVKHWFDDDIELKPNEDANTITPDISVSDVETEFNDTTSFDSFIYDNSIEIDKCICTRAICVCDTIDQ